jgi:hypothetical protein
MTWTARLGAAVLLVCAAATWAMATALIFGSLGQLVGWNRAMVGRIAAITGLAIGLVALPGMIHRFWPAARQIPRTLLGTGAFLGLVTVAVVGGLLKATDPLEAASLSEMVMLQGIQALAWVAGVTIAFGVISSMGRRTTTR